MDTLGGFKVIVKGSGRTEETTKRLQDLMPSNLENEKIVLNVGNSSLNEDCYKDYIILNKVNSVKNCVNKKEMFKTLKKNGVKTLYYLDLNKPIDKLKSIFLLGINKELVLRNREGLKIINKKNLKEVFNKNWDYATIKENRLIEYRVIIFKNKVVRITFKLNKNNDFALKQNNSTFIEVDINKIPLKVRKNLLKAVEMLGIDLCGIDFLVNKKGKYKIIEVNSGMAMCEKSINSFYEILRYYLFMNR